MKFYKHVFSEWIGKLHGFPMLERSAFRDLVEHIASRDQYPGFSLEQAYRVCGAFTRSERAAVRAVLKRDFVVCRDGGYACAWADDLLHRQQEQQERLRALKAGDGWAKFRDRVLERDGYRCVYCGARDVPFELDHVFPRSRGGVDEPANLVTACKRCNTSKGAQTPEEWGAARA